MPEMSRVRDRPDTETADQNFLSSLAVVLVCEDGRFFRVPCYHNKSLSFDIM